MATTNIYSRTEEKYNSCLVSANRMWNEGKIDTDQYQDRINACGFRQSVGKGIDYVGDLFGGWASKTKDTVVHAVKNYSTPALVKKVGAKAIDANVSFWRGSIAPIILTAVFVGVALVIAKNIISRSAT